MTGNRRLALTLLSLALVLGCAAACSPARVPLPGPEATTEQGVDPRVQAAVEATAIIQQAQATALVLQAQAQATALVQQAQAPIPTGEAVQALPVLTPTPGAPAEDDATPEPTAEGPEATGDALAVEMLGVGFAAEGAFIVVNYRAPVRVAQQFWPGVLSVTDEASGTVFNEVPLMPLIGPLIARPIEEGQAGYVMLVHAPAILRPGALVTVALADYTFEHVPVQ